MKLCDECNLRAANIHLTQIIENETQSFHLCEECAQKRGINISIDEEALVEAPVSPLPAESDPACPSCGTKLSAFRQSGLLGCSACYSAFEDEIDEQLLQSNGTTVHKGKSYGRKPQAPTPAAPKADASELRKELEIAVRNEEFERAAKLRDTLNGLSNTEAANAQ